MKRWSYLALAAALALTAPAARAQTPEQWVEWGDRVHGGFGSLIALGIRVGLDAMQRMGADRRQLSVHYVDGPQTPCPCVLDGIAIAVSASVGQRTLSLDPERAAPGVLARVTFVHRTSGRKLTYELPHTVLSVMQTINRDTKGVARYEAVMKLDPTSLFRVVQ
ncbi:MAG: formylmethanofuran dehydrogenase subunit E family protein [Burkholderiales bacterium]|nr:formylmethanofuran dehydrogenase subunit E family protein [Burkholderiales bacterium]